MPQPEVVDLQGKVKGFAAGLRVVPEGLKVASKRLMVASEELRVVPGEQESASGVLFRLA